MATSIEERILDLVRTKLLTITTDNGYEATVQQVKYAHEPEAPAEIPAEALPAVQIRHDDTQTQPHLRGAIECEMRLMLICVAAYDQTNEKLSDLVADVMKLIGANERWNDGSVNLARLTWIGAPSPHETEVEEVSVSAQVPVSILFRISSTNPYAIAEI